MLQGISITFCLPKRFVSEGQLILENLLDKELNMFFFNKSLSRAMSTLKLLSTS